MATFDDLAARFLVRFQLYSTAVAGERALASAAGIVPGSMRTWMRGDAFRNAFSEDATRELGIYYADHLGNASTVFHQRGALRVAWTSLDLNRITTQILTKSNREVFEGKPGLVDLMKERGSGAIGLLAQRKMARPTFQVKDSSGRTWEDADRLVHTIVRDFAYQTHIDARFDAATKDGVKSVIVEHPESGHEVAGTVIDLTLPMSEWMAKRDEIFHMNSRLDITYGAVQA